MEQRSNKKVLTIICITLIVILFALGIVFKLIANDKKSDSEYYDKHQSQIEEYYNSLPE